MAHFLEIPPELLPIIFGFVLNPEHIFTLCLVNKSFNFFATPFLYCRVSIFAWHKDAKTKVVALFRTLSKCPHLAFHVKKLEIKDFPKALHIADILRICTQGIRNCVNLRSCVWTRDGSLHSAILESLCDCPLLHELEINGNLSEHNLGSLTRFSHLTKISLITPNARVLHILPAWTSITSETLRSLTILCNPPTHVTDTFLLKLAPNLRGLEYLSVIGCPRVTDVSIGAIVSTNKQGFIGINIEGVSQEFDMSAFKATCLRTMAFRQLKSITLTVHEDMALTDWTNDVGELLSSAPLESFTIYSVNSSKWASISDEFWQGIVANNGQRLKKISAHRIRFSLAALGMICSQCPLLEQLFIVMEQQKLDDAVHLFALAKGLKALHVNILARAGDPLATSPSAMMSKAVSIVSVCSSTLVLIGCNMRVWQVKRNVYLDENGEKYAVPSLAPQENPDVPEQFLVVRA